MRLVGRLFMMAGFFGVMPDAWAQSQPCHSAIVNVSQTSDGTQTVASCAITDTKAPNCTSNSCVTSCPTLRSAVDFANHNQTDANTFCATTIILPPGTYNLTQNCTGSVNDNTCGDLNLRAPITITAQNQPLTHTDLPQGSVGLTVIDAGTLSVFDRAINIDTAYGCADPIHETNCTGWQNVSLVGLEIRNGIATIGRPGPNKTIGDGIHSYGGAVLNQGAVSLTLLRCTLTDNTADNGGGFANLDPQPNHTVNIYESTIVDNTANLQGGGIFNQTNGGSQNGNGLLTLLQSTVANNTANTLETTFLGITTGGGGGYFDAAPLQCTQNFPCMAPMLIENSIIAGNQDSTPLPNQQYDCGGYLSANFVGKNVIQNAQALCTNKTVIAADPLLYALANNGGSSSTLALHANSIAIDTGDNSVCFNASTQTYFLDQRLNKRPIAITSQTLICDVGAYEFQGNDVSLTQTVSSAQAKVGDQITYTLTITNTSTESADVTLSDPLPAGESIEVAPNPSQGTCTVDNNNLITCVMTLSPKSLATVTFTITSSVLGKLTNTATAQVLYDTTPSDNTASADVTIVDRDLTIAKTAGPTQGTSSGNVMYVIIVSNPGISDATNVVISDPLPQEICTCFLQAQSSLGGCSIDTHNTVTCHIGVLKPGEQVIATIIGTTAPQFSSGKITNRAYVTADGHSQQSSSTDIVFNGPSALPVQSSFFSGGSLAGPCRNMSGGNVILSILSLAVFFILNRKDTHVERGTCKISRKT